MNDVVSRTELFDAFAKRLPTTLWSNNGNLHTGIIRSIEHEDGSGHSYLVTFYSMPQIWAHVRTH